MVVSDGFPQGLTALVVDVHSLGDYDMTKIYKYNDDNRCDYDVT